MRKLFFFAIIFVFALFEVTVLDHLKLFGVKPDLFLICVIMASLIFIFELRTALLFSVFTGFLKDILGANAFAINVLLFPLWCFLIIKLSRNVLIENNFILATLALIIVILHDIVTRCISLSLGTTIPLTVFLCITLLESLYTAAVLPWVLRFTQRALAYRI